MFVDRGTNIAEKENGAELIDLLSLKEDDPRLKDLKRQVADRGKTIQMWVHTHYEEEGGARASSDDALDQYQKGREMFMAKTGGLPVIALLEMTYSQHVPEDEQGSEHIEERYRKHYEGVRDTIFFVRTYPHSPLPYIEGVSDPYNPTDAWNVLSKKLINVGVKHVVFRGRNLEVTKGYEVQDEGQRGRDVIDFAQRHGQRRDGGWIVDTPDACVGQAMRELDRRGFTILPSRWTYPHQLRRSSL